MRRPARTAGLAALIGLLCAGCFPTPATLEARQVATLYDGLLVIAALVAAVVVGLTTIALIRFRRRPGDDELPAQTRGHTALEVTWTAIPALIVLAIFGATFAVLAQVDRRDVPPGAEIRVTAFRWGWRFDYPGQGISISGLTPTGPEVVVPVGQTIRITLAATDVIHSFYVPQFLFKRDAIPGRDTAFEFTVPEAGAYGGQCAEFCGVYHSQMPFTVRAVSPTDYAAWLQSEGGAPSPRPS
ncbi:MAG: cytochrome c oxidase subunit II [Chloroflexota bacterium]